MCGIAGIVSEGLPPPERAAAVERMCAAMVHRGPDGWGTETFDTASLAMRRLAILDLSDHGRQPMANEDASLWLVFNGEVYNFQALRAGLEEKGHRFDSRTDSEVILHLYEEKGLDVSDGLRGMFAFGLWDRPRRRLLLSRDRFGIKPLYYAELPGGLVFASELNALLASGLVERRLDAGVLDSYLSFGYVPPPRTLIAGVKALPPGYRLVWEGGRVDIRRWWTLPSPGTTACRGEQIVPRLRELLEETIRLHRISDVPVGAFLSGGVDSTAVVGLMTRVLNESVRTFSIGFADGPAHLNELGYAQTAAAAYGTDHSAITVTAGDVRDQLPRAIRSLDQPSFDGLNTYFVSRAAREGGVTVALSGLGGDEVFGGYDAFRIIPRWARAASAWGHVPRGVRQQLVAMIAGSNGHTVRSDRWRKVRWLPHVVSPVGMYALARLTLWPDEARRLYTPDTAAAVSDSGYHDAVALLEKQIPDRARPWQMVTALELSAYMGWRLLRDTDAMSMAHSLEVRVPLVDHKVVEFVTGLPAGWEARLGYPKRLLIASLADVLPPAILNRPKQGFAFPLDHWMRHELRPLVDVVLSREVVRARGLFNWDAVRRLYDGFQAGQIGYPAIWQIVVLELWMQQTFDSAAPR
jgi:asparagine synthase (glutamine-hydrolysing)